MAETQNRKYNGKEFVEAHGYDTYDSCVRAKEVYGVSSVTLVSQSYHLPRAVTICRYSATSARMSSKR